jgi:hypothetical protein
MMAMSGDLAPWHLRLRCKQFRGQRLDGLANYHQPVQQRIESQLCFVISVVGFSSL